MQSNIALFQSTQIGEGEAQISLFELLISHLENLNNIDIFDKIQIVVPNYGMAAWLRDKVTRKFGICANLDFVVLLGPVIERLYLQHNPEHILFDFNTAKYFIYQYICKNKIDTVDAKEFNNYIYVDGQLDKFRVYQLSVQLQHIFQEYIYLRTNELINLEKSAFPLWQKHILQHLLSHSDKTFLDVYKYFLSSDKKSLYLNLPKNLFIFGLTSIYPSQLEIVKKLSQVTNIYWYYQFCSYEYYGDLLSDIAKNKLEKKLFKQPDFSLDDLYLVDGNPLLANLGQQSREFIELLQIYDIPVYDFKLNVAKPKATPTMLNVIQEDIYHMKYRIRSEYRLQNDNDYYESPILIQNYANDVNELFDLPNQQTSIKINSCHNKMREVQVMFNEIVGILNNNHDVLLDEILICAPDIDDYSTYITAVFDNEVVLQNDGKCHKILYSITGNKKPHNYKVIEAIKLIINTPYSINVNYFMELITQTEIKNSLEISDSDIDLVRQWLLDNAIHFGYDAKDYTPYGYVDYPIHSFLQLLNNLVLGACLTNSIYEKNQQLPIYNNLNGEFCPYDNIDSSQINLCNKILFLIHELEELRDFFYSNQNIYKEVTIEEVYLLLSKLHNKLFSKLPTSDINEEFLGNILNIELDTLINLPILNMVLDEYLVTSKNKVSFDGKITCASMQYIRNIPYKYVYVLGMNFTEFPKPPNQNQLSILTKQWYLADRNYNIEDKQTFLDIILATKVQLYLSYIGREETNNATIKPSPLLTLLINTMGHSFINFWNEIDVAKFNFKNVICQNSLHPFYNNLQNNFSVLWHQVARNIQEEYIDRSWDFSLMSPLKLSDVQKVKYLKPKFNDLINTFLYTNSNLYRVLGINNFNDKIELENNESITLINRNLAKKIYPYLDKHINNQLPNKLHKYLAVKGLLSYDHIGKYQFKYYTNLYKSYLEKRGTKEVNLRLNYAIHKTSEIISLEINQMVFVENNSVIITPLFSDINDKPISDRFEDLPYKLKISALIISLMINNGAVFDDNLIYNKIIVRQLNSLNDKHDFLVTARDKSCLDLVLSYYLRSIGNPVLIHRNAIDTYAKSVNILKKDGRPYTKDECLTMALTRYSDTFTYNNDLARIRQDIIFGQIADVYFDFIKKENGVNDIEQIGVILSNLVAKIE